MASFFISHSRDGITAAAAIQTYLRERKYPVAFLDVDPYSGIRAGSAWEREIYEQIASADALLFLSTPQSRTSQWCFAEITMARALNRQIFPINVEGPIGHELLSDLQWVDFGRDGSMALDRLVTALGETGLSADAAFEPDLSRPPYPGLSAFDAADAGMFFGRDDTIRSIQRRLYTSEYKWTSIIGPSGSGKSSLIRAGLIPRLTGKRGWKVIAPFTPTDRPLSELARALALTQGDVTLRRTFEDQIRTDPQQFVELLRDITAAEPNTPLLAVIDQAEQLLRPPASAERATLMAALGAGLRSVATFRLMF